MSRSRFSVAIVAVLLVLGAAGSANAIDNQDPGGGGSGPCGEPQCGCTPSSSQVYVCSYTCACAGGVLPYRSCTECAVR